MTQSSQRRVPGPRSEGYPLRATLSHRWGLGHPLAPGGCSAALVFEMPQEGLGIGGPPPAGTPLPDLTPRQHHCSETPGQRIF